MPVCMYAYGHNVHFSVQNYNIFLNCARKKGKIFAYVRKKQYFCSELWQRSVFLTADTAD